jgi:hypothetical protein
MGNDGYGNEIEIRVRESGEANFINIAFEIVKNERLRKNRETLLVH